MKKLLIGTGLIVLVSSSAFSQGTVTFQNFTGATAKVYTSSAPGQYTPAPAGFTVVLLAGAVGTPIGSLNVVATPLKSRREISVQIQSFLKFKAAKKCLS